MRTIISLSVMLLSFVPSSYSSPSFSFLDPGQARINIGVTGNREMSQVRDIMESSYGAQLMREVDDLSLMTFIIKEVDLKTVLVDARLAAITEYIEEDVIRYVPELPELLMYIILPGEGGQGLSVPGGEEPAGVPNDPLYGNQWGPACIDAEAAWDRVPNAPGIILAIVDTGVDVSHVDLKNHYDTGIDRDFANNDYDANDDMGHGTHVAGISAAETGNNTGIAGLAPVTIMGVKVLNFMGFGFDSDIVAGINYAADNGAHVINMSLGATTFTQAMKNACDNAFYDKDVVVVAASGNSNTSQNFYPASFESVVGVAALGTCDTRASFSNYGYDNVEVSAPGQNIYSTLPDHLTFWNLFGTFPYDYGYMDGTSMASPHVAGVAAGYLAYASWLSAQQVRNILDNQADDLGDPYYFGAGRVDYYPFQDMGDGGGFEGDRSGVAETRAVRPEIEDALDIMKYGRITVEVVDEGGRVMTSFQRDLGNPEDNPGVKLSDPARYAYRLRAGDKASRLIRF